MTDPMWCFENYGTAAELIDELTAELNEAATLLTPSLTYRIRESDKVVIDAWLRRHDVR